MKSFIYALRGFRCAAEQERHMRIHLAFTFYVVEAGGVLRISPIEWAVILLCTALVMSLEMVNTALERACDSVTREKNALIGAAKDCCAGAVFVAAVLSAIIGCVIFFSAGRPGAALEYFADHPIAAGLTVLTLPLWIIFIFKKRRSRE